MQNKWLKAWKFSIYYNAAALLLYVILIQALFGLTYSWATSTFLLIIAIPSLFLTAISVFSWKTKRMPESGSGYGAIPFVILIQFLVGTYYLISLLSILISYID